MREIQRPNIVAVFEHYQLRILGRDVGGWRKAECPRLDHQDTNPSASLNEDEGKFWCHACGEGGDGFDILMERESFVGFAACRAYAERVFGEGDSPVREERGSSSLLPGAPRHRASGGIRQPPWLRIR